MFLGWALAGEQITLRTLLAAAVIVAAVVLVITARQSATQPSASADRPATQALEPQAD